MTQLAQELPSGQVALLRFEAGRFRAQALQLNRAATDAADARMTERKRGAAGNERVLIRCRLVRVTRGLFARAEERFDVYRINGRVEGLIAAGCVWWEEAVAIAKDALKGRVSVSLAGTRTPLVMRGGVAVPDPRLVGASALTGNEGDGWKKPAPGEFLEVRK